MKFKGLLTDRQALISALEEETANAAVYSGAPSFRYSIGDYTVLRDGSLEVADRRVDRALLTLQRADRGHLGFACWDRLSDGFFHGEDAGQHREHARVKG